MCRCDDWPPPRKSLSGGGVAGNGKFGDKCRYSHGEDQKGADKKPKKKGPGEERPKARCRDFQAGSCKFGDKCRYSHADSGLKPLEVAAVDDKTAEPKKAAQRKVPASGGSFHAIHEEVRSVAEQIDHFREEHTQKEAPHKQWRA